MSREEHDYVCGWNIADLEDAMDQLRKAGIRDVPRPGAGVIALLPAWSKSALRELSPMELQGVVGLWVAGSDKRFPLPGQLMAQRAAGLRDQRRRAEAANGGTLPVGMAPTGPSVERCFGREWEKNGTQYRDYKTALSGHKHTDIPPAWRAMGYTIDLPVGPHQSADLVGSRWIKGYEYRPHAPGGPLHFGTVHVNYAAERGRRGFDNVVYPFIPKNRTGGVDG